MPSSTITPRVGVIGGGAAGITAVKELLERGVDVIGFEKGDGIGGLWVYENTSGLRPRRRTSSGSSAAALTSAKRARRANKPRKKMIPMPIQTVAINPADGTAQPW